MTNIPETLPGDEGLSQVKTREMYKRLMAVAELLKKSAHQQNDTVEIQQPEGEKTQDSKAVVS
jgi:hypothetical protein